MAEIKIALKNKYIWVSIDETTDAVGRFVANIIVGELSTDADIYKKSHLLTSECLGRANHTTISRLFDDALKLIDPNFDRDIVLLFASDAMVKAAKGLQIMYSKMIHITCLAHGMHRIDEEIRSIFPSVDRLICNIKKLFLKRQAVYKYSKKFCQTHRCHYSQS